LPYFYLCNYNFTSSSAANATTDSLRVISTAGADLRVCGVYLACYSTTAGGYDLRVGRATTSSTGGTAYTVVARDPFAPATTAQSVSTNNTTAATGFTSQLTVGAPATGGMGGWIMVDPDAAIKVGRGGGTTSGQLAAINICAVASVTSDQTVEWIEN